MGGVESRRTHPFQSVLVYFVRRSAARAEHVKERNSMALVDDCLMMYNPENRRVRDDCRVSLFTENPRWISDSSGIVERSLWGSMKTGILAGISATVVVLVQEVGDI